MNANNREHKPRNGINLWTCRYQICEPKYTTNRIFEQREGIRKKYQLKIWQKQSTLSQQQPRFSNWEDSSDPRQIRCVWGGDHILLALEKSSKECKLLDQEATEGKGSADITLPQGNQEIEM